MKERLDTLLVQNGLAPSREKAKALIMAGCVYVNGSREDKAGTFFHPEKIRDLEVRGSNEKYVSRGGLKLEKAIQVFPIDLEGKVCVDIGASTGGFTDCMLQNGAAKVYAIDVGRGQLDWKLRQDSRVVCMERVNFRYFEPDGLGEKADLATADVSFISLKLMLTPAFGVLKEDGQMVCLIKPQFEAGRSQVGKNGVVRDLAVHKEVICRVLGYAQEAGFSVQGMDSSPIRGAQGNIEYLTFLSKGGGGIPPEEWESLAEAVITSVTKNGGK